MDVEREKKTMKVPQAERGAREEESQPHLSQNLAKLFAGTGTKAMPSPAWAFCQNILGEACE